MTAVRVAGALRKHATKTEVGSGGPRLHDLSVDRPLSRSLMA